MDGVPASAQEIRSWMVYLVMLYCLTVGYIGRKATYSVRYPLMMLDKNYIVRVQMYACPDRAISVYYRVGMI